MNSIYSDTTFIADVLERQLERMYSDNGEAVLDVLLKDILKTQREIDENTTELLTMFEHLYGLDSILEKLNG